MKTEYNRYMKRLGFVVVLLVTSSLVNSCTDLDEKYEGNLTGNQVNEADGNSILLYNNLLISLRQIFQNPLGDVISLSEISTDELMAPTRGGEWGDNGVWRQLHQHGWDGDHVQVTGCFNDLNGFVFSATNFLRFHPDPQQESAALFYRAFVMYWELDLFGQVPYREPGESTLLPAKVRKGTEALEYIISEINSVINSLPDGDARQPSKNAAKVLLMKCYLNKGAYTNRASPSFDAADMNKVISLADEVLNTGQYEFSDNYFDNFAPNNTVIGKENIFTQENVGGSFPNSNLVIYSLIPLHYNSAPYGLNGWVTPSEFYDKFETFDLRRGQPYSSDGNPPNPGNRINMGFLVGQQYNVFDDQPLTYGPNDSKRPLVFTRDAILIETESNLEVTGIRPQKYAFDYINLGGPFNSPLDNDWVYFRLPDVLLMKAEAILRGGTPTGGSSFGNTALEIVNKIRTHASRAASPLASIDLNQLLDERGRELWLECWRRQDMIRFGKFLEPFHEKKTVSDPKYLVFPIPNQQLAVNKNLIQNPGY